MEKIKLRVLCAAVIAVFSCAWVFAQDADTPKQKTYVIYDSTGRTEVTVTLLPNKGTSEEAPVKNIFGNYDVMLIAGGAVAVFFLLTLTALSGFIFIAVTKLPKRIDSKSADIKNHLDGKITELKDALSGLRSANSQPVSSLSSAETMRLNKELTEVKAERDRLRAQCNTLQTENTALRTEKRTSDSIASGSLDPKDVFNSWAANPAVSPLPKAFHYIDGDMHIRTKRTLAESMSPESKWITNRVGANKYLFPNPNSFNQMTNIGELYKMDQAKLKGRGQNKIKIVKPCDMTADGYIEFAGELEIL